MVSSMSVTNGASNGGTELTMTGVRLSGDVSVVIDTVACVYDASKSSDIKIVCVTGNKDAVAPKVKDKSMEIRVNG